MGRQRSKRESEMAAIATSTYNPGLLTSILLFVPAYFWFIRYLTRQLEDYKKLIIGSLGWAFLAHVVMVAGLLMANWFNLFPEFIYFIVLIVWSIIPIAMFNKKSIG